MSTDESDATLARRPDLRAVHGAGDLVVTSWSPGLRWADLHRRRLQHGEAFTGPHGLAVFELWEEADRIVAREISGERRAEPTPLRRLEAWADARGLPLQLASALPEWGPEPTLLQVEYRDTNRPPAFRFVVEPGDSPATVRPWGWGAEGAADRIPEPWNGAIGDVFALDRDRAVVHFARVPDRLRRSSERKLHSWARSDGWTLTIAEGTLPLARPRQTTVAHQRSGRCTDCGDTLSYGFASAMSFHHKRFLSTRCDVCGGRRAWFDLSEVR